MLPQIFKPAHAFHSTGDMPLTSQRIGALGVAHHIVSGVMSRCGCTSLSLFPSDTILRDTIPCFVAHLSFGRERPRVLSRNALAASPGSMSMNQVLAITKTNRLLSCPVSCHNIKTRQLMFDNQFILICLFDTSRRIIEFAFLCSNSSVRKLTKMVQVGWEHFFKIYIRIFVRNAHLPGKTVQLNAKRSLTKINFITF